MAYCSNCGRVVSGQYCSQCGMITGSQKAPASSAKRASKSRLMLSGCLIFFGLLVVLGIIGRFLPSGEKPVGPAPVPPATEAPKAAAQSAPPALRGDEGITRLALSTYVTESFGMPGYETTWYRNIVKVEIEGRTAVAQTDLNRSDQKAKDVCIALSGFVFSNDNKKFGLTSVRVMGSGGQVLVDRRGVTKRCE